MAPYFRLTAAGRRCSASELAVFRDQSQQLSIMSEKSKRRGRTLMERIDVGRE
jgi:hypothetical protein